MLVDHSESEWRTLLSMRDCALRSAVHLHAVHLPRKHAVQQHILDTFVAWISSMGFFYWLLCLFF
jgi:hypothetical protein